MFKTYTTYAIVLISLALTSSSLTAREWTDDTGRHTQEAELVDFDEQLVVLKKANGSLVAVPRERLSDKDLSWLESQAARDEVKRQSTERNVWLLKDGTELVGKVMEYGRNTTTVERKRGKLYAQGRLFDNLPELQQQVILQTVSYLERTKLGDAQALEELVIEKDSQPLRYQTEGVIIKMSPGQFVSVPFFLFTAADEDLLRSRWDRWLEAEPEQSTQQQESLLLRALAEQYQRDRNIDRQIQILQLGSDWFDIWQVVLIPGTGVGGRLMRVPVPAVNSAHAVERVLREYPQHRIVAVRRLPRY